MPITSKGKITSPYILYQDIKKKAPKKEKKILRGKKKPHPFGKSSSSLLFFILFIASYANEDNNFCYTSVDCDPLYEKKRVRE